MAKVTVRYDETLDDAMRRFKQQVERSGIMQKVREKEFFLSPSQKRKLKAENSKKRR